MSPYPLTMRYTRLCHHTSMLAHVILNDLNEKKTTIVVILAYMCGVSKIVLSELHSVLINLMSIKDVNLKAVTKEMYPVPILLK